MKTISLKSPLLKNYSSVHNDVKHLKNTSGKDLQDKNEWAVEEAVHHLDQLFKRFVPYFFLSAAIYLLFLCIQFIYFFLY